MFNEDKNMGRSLIEILKLGDAGNYSIIDKLRYEGSKEMLEVYRKQLEERLRTSSNARWDIALTLATVVRTGAWTAYYSQTCNMDKLWCAANPGESYLKSPYRFEGGMSYATHSKPFFVWCKVNFGLCRTTVYNYLEVVDEFATYIDDKDTEPEYRINLEAEQYQFWQLIEMTSLTYQERLKVQPNWTREEIRAYKKQLREKDKPKIQPAEQIEAEEKPLTEAQQRFSKYSKDDLINEVVKLEGEISKLTAQVENLLTKAFPYGTSADIDSKHQLQGVIEKLLNSYDYVITLNGRKQGVKAFSGVVAKNILSSYDQDNISPEPIQQKFAV